MLRYKHYVFQDLGHGYKQSRGRRYTVKESKLDIDFLLEDTVGGMRIIIIIISNL